MKNSLGRKVLMWGVLAFIVYSLGEQVITGSVEVGRPRYRMTYTRATTPVAYWVTFAIFAGVGTFLAWTLLSPRGKMLFDDSEDIDPGPPSQEVKVSDVAAVIARLKAVGNDKSSVDFTYWPPGEDDPEKAFGISFALRQGRAGLHWIPEGPTKKRDQATFRQVVEASGHTVLTCKLYGMKSFRVEETAGATSLTELFEDLMRELCSLNPQSKLNLDISGFTWP